MKILIAEDDLANIKFLSKFLGKTFNLGINSLCGSLVQSKDEDLFALTLEIELPDSITKIDIEAFCATRKLKTVKLGNNIEELAYRAFHDCHALESIVLPESIRIIKEDAFDSCVNLKTINIPGNAINLGISIFSSCFKLENITIGEGIKKIPDYMFRKCKSLSEITLPTTIEQIGMKVFSGCISLKTIYVKSLIPPTVPKEYIVSGGINKNQVESWLALKNVADVIIYVPAQSLDLYKSFDKLLI